MKRMLAAKPTKLAASPPNIRYLLALLVLSDSEKKEKKQQSCSLCFLAST